MHESTASPNPLDLPPGDPIGRMLAEHLALHTDLDAVTFEWAATVQCLGADGKVRYYRLTGPDTPREFGKALFTAAAAITTRGVSCGPPSRGLSTGVDNLLSLRWPWC